MELKLNPKLLCRIAAITFGYYLLAFSSNEMRLLGLCGPYLNTTLIERAKNAGYNHALVFIGPDQATQNEWTNGVYANADGGEPRFKNMIRDAFLAYHGIGMTMIPEIASGNRHSGGLKYTNNSSIKWTPLKTVNLEARANNKLLFEHPELYALGVRNRDDVIATISDVDALIEKSSACPNFAPDPDGYDKSFINLIKVIAEAYEEAYAIDNTLEQHLEYIHIGHDEPLTFQSPVDPESQLLFGRSAYDLDYIYNNAPNHGIPSYQGDRWLLADELTRRVDDIEDIQVGASYVLQNTKIMLWADMWDPQHFGGYFNTYPAIDLLDATLKDKIIFMPWKYVDTQLNPSPNIAIHDGTDYALGGDPIKAYFDVTSDATGQAYDANQALSYFQSKGYKTIFAWSYPLGDPYLAPEAIKHAFNFVEAAKNKSNNIGYCAAFWSTDKNYRLKWSDNIDIDPTDWDPALPIYRQSSKFNVMEILANLSDAVTMPRTSVGDHNSTFCGYLWSISKNKYPELSASYTIDQKLTSKLDYLLVNQNTMYPDCKYIDDPKVVVNYYDAMLYCNRLSLREGLQPVYIFGYDANHQSYYTDLSSGIYKSIIKHLQSFRQDLSSNGYRLPTKEELQFNEFVGQTSTSTREWIWNPRADDHSYSVDNKAWIYNTNGTIQSVTPAVHLLEIAFRVVRNGVTGVEAPVPQITLTGPLPAQKSWCNTITIMNGSVNVGQSSELVSKNGIIIKPESSISGEIHAHIDPNM